MNRQIDRELIHAEENIDIAHKYLLNDQVEEAITHICLAQTILRRGIEHDMKEIEKKNGNNKGG